MAKILIMHHEGFMSGHTNTVPAAFIWRRIHSLTGLLIVLFLIEHLLTNSQAALLIGNDGNGFVRAVNFIHNLPYLPVIEIGLIGVPILLHAVLGIRYAITGKLNAHKSNGTKPSMHNNGRNRAYSWQRFTSWILLVGLIGHVSFMRFYHYPITAKEGDQKYYFVRVHMDNGLYTVAKRLGVQLYDQQKIDSIVSNFNGLKNQIEQNNDRVENLEKTWPKGILSAQGVPYDNQTAQLLDNHQAYEQRKVWIEALTDRSIDKSEVIAVATQFGDAVLLTVRDAFKNPIVAILYTIFVIAACFHGFNGLWTFCISWGVILRMRSQSRMVNICIAIMVLIACLGLASIWGTYWVNLKN